MRSSKFGEEAGKNGQRHYRMDYQVGLPEAFFKSQAHI
jgi:hypothetical protein